MTRLLLLAVSLSDAPALADFVAPKVIDSPAAVYPPASTERAYAADWRDFSAFCARIGRGRAPRRA